jgi:hypothetical protein
MINFSQGSKMTKQSKNDKPADESKTTVIAVATDGQAPVLPAFEPYKTNPEYEAPYSKVLMDKSNELARQCFKDQEGYNTFTNAMKLSPYGVDGESSAVTLKNFQFFNHMALDAAIDRMTMIRLGPIVERWALGTRLQDVIKKVRKLEKIYDDYEILDEDARERIINTVLIPAQQFGMTDYTTHRPGLRFPMQKSVAAEVLSEDEVEAIDSIVSFVPMIRERFQFYKPWTQGATKEELLAPLLPAKTGDVPVHFAWQSPEDDAKLIKRIKQLRNFFNSAIPTNVQYDYIPKTRWPQQSTQAMTKMVGSSAKLRDVSAGYIREDKRLSDLLEAIVEMSNDLRAWLMAEVSDLGAYFQYLNRIGMTYEHLVEESKERIHDQDAPW